jgi:ribosomal protein S18 acetylase RimI-like enzyme
MTLHLPSAKLPWPFGRREDAPATPSAPDVPVTALSPTQAQALRLPWSSRFTPEGLARYVGRAPGWAWTVPGTGEYLVAEGWRHRDDLGMVLEAQARRYRAALVNGALADLRARGVRCLLLTDEEWTAHGRIYQSLGFARLERIVYYQLLGLHLPLPIRRPLPRLTFVPVDAVTLPDAVEIDHRSFPWLWWNSRAEFETYLHTPGVRVALGLHEGEPVGYAGFTITRDWGHLDRLAVTERAQGRGWGAALLAYALEEMARVGVYRVTLSTQETNTASQRLYRGFGFRQTHEAHNIYGRWLSDPPDEG